LAYNLWWSWHPEAQDLYRSIDPDLWQDSYHNPVKFLAGVTPQAVTSALTRAYLASYDSVMADFDAYMQPDQTWFSRTHSEQDGMTIAYFSPEFGLHESLPIYSGGLGILAGDHCKEASDLGLPLVGVGFLYPQGYFRQEITPDGSQQAVYNKLSFAGVPAQPALTPDGKPVMIRVEMPGRSVYALVWRIQVGRVPIFLMDTDVEPNALSDRDLSARLYGGDHEIRLAQEIVLGVGGVRALNALRIAPQVWHMNEGHSAFLILERLRTLISAGVSPSAARDEVRRSTVFTTHTPVPAGNDTFTYDLIERYFASQWRDFGMTRDEFFEFARQDLPWGTRFSMTVLALRLSASHNGVSRIHGGVSRRMWRFVWPHLTENETPIGDITNGVHTATWLAPEMRQLYDTYLGSGWTESLDSPRTWDGIAAIPDQVLWKTRRDLKQSMVTFVRQRVAEQRRRQGGPVETDAGASPLLDPDVLTIGFARRFATYKRATLLFRDLDRLRRLMNQPARPLQFVFAGKAHPNDEGGKQLIRDIHSFSMDPAIQGRIVFVEEYDMCVGRALVQGVDVWLNTPRKPNEASGTSGQKAALNGVPNASILDGWWAEAYNGTNGWAIASSDEEQTPEMQDDHDSHALYDVIEHSIAPLYYERANGLPHAWLGVVREAIRTVAPLYSTRRMLKQYIEDMYLAAMEAATA
jgi:starch phosphorylase